MRKGWHVLSRCPSGVFCVYLHIFVCVFTAVNFEDVQLHHQLLRPPSVLQLLRCHRHLNLLSSQPGCWHLGERRRRGCPLTIRRCLKFTTFVCQSSCRVSRNTLNGYFLAGRDMAWWPVSVCSHKMPFFGLLGLLWFVLANIFIASAWAGLFFFQC